MKTQLENNTITLYLEGRIDSNNAADVEKELFEAVDQAPGAEIVLDAGNLEYISSAGLRVLMKLRKAAKKAVPVLDVSPEVYDIFDVTGFTELMDVHKKLREISIEGCEMIGQGATASVYRLDPETIVKVFNKTVDMSMVQNENTKSKAAFLAGIPTAISFDTVKVGDCYGTVFELLNAVDLKHVLDTDKEHMADHIASFAREIRKLHEIEVDPEQFYDVRASALDRVKYLIGVVGTKEEIDTLTKMYEIMPERHTFLHGDCHTGNIMVQDGEFVFIDLCNGGMGHPIIDMCSMATMYKFPTLGDNWEVARKRSYLTKDLTRDEALLIWNTYLKSYLDTDDQAFIAKAERQIIAYAALRTLFAAIALPGVIPEDRLQAMKMMALGYCKNLEPICF